jgi:hypothetical protein
MMKHKARNLIAGAVIVGVASLGTGGVAFAAQSPSTTSPSASTAARRNRTFCERQVPRLPSLNARRVRDEQKISDLQKAIAVARAHHDNNLAARLERQLVQVQRDHAVLVVNIAAIDRICHV